MKINDLFPFIEERKQKKRLGRGPATGQGCTAGRGNKGQNARAGGGVRPGFEGGQMPLQRRLPKRGFKNHFRVECHTLSLERISSAFEDNASIEVGQLYETFGLDRHLPIKILSDGEAPASLKIQAHRFSKAAKEKIESKGGQTVLLEG